MRAAELPVVNLVAPCLEDRAEMSRGNADSRVLIDRNNETSHKPLERPRFEPKTQRKPWLCGDHSHERLVLCIAR